MVIENKNVKKKSYYHSIKCDSSVVLCFVITFCLGLYGDPKNHYRTSSFNAVLECMK